ncbi:hypothetical protein AB3X91_03650 [Paraburkholderia sp. BR14263]|uniref:hypothetical protein n=1 Tax=unclassified Paraburkholderia TaxID=2615204 RepID=UPI0034CFA5CF
MSDHRNYELKRCPCCDGTAQQPEVQQIDTVTYVGSIDCDECDLSVTEQHGSASEAEAVQRVVDIWNGRPIPQRDDDIDAAVRTLTEFADRYARMAKIGNGLVSCEAVSQTIRVNVIGSFFRAMQSVSPRESSGEQP